MMTRLTNKKTAFFFWKHNPNVAKKAFQKKFFLEIWQLFSKQYCDKTFLFLLFFLLWWNFALKKH